jgi:hypothetical protein
MILIQKPNGDIEFYRTDTATDKAIKLTLEQMGIYGHLITGGDKYEIEDCFAVINAYAIKKEEQAKVPPLPYKIDDVINLDGEDYEIWDISSEPDVQGDDGNWHYEVTLHFVGGDKSDVLIMSDEQIVLEEDDVFEEDDDEEY